MKFYIVIPAHNEEAFLEKTLQSLVEQTHAPSKIIVVNDSSTDATQNIIEIFTTKYTYIHSIYNTSNKQHLPGSKVINAFNKGLTLLDTNYDVICKFDGDLIFPKNYLEKVATAFKNNSNCGIAGGFCTIEKNGFWKTENLTNRDHIRGALKAYSKNCFEKIGGLKNTMGWDTVDELLAKYHNFKVITIDDLLVQHLKSTGNTYSKKARYKQGAAFYKMRYGILLTQIAALKLAIKKKSILFYFDCIKGYYKEKKEKTPFIVSKNEGIFIRKLRWKGIKNKLF